MQTKIIMISHYNWWLYSYIIHTRNKFKSFHHVFVFPLISYNKVDYQIHINTQTCIDLLLHLTPNKPYTTSPYNKTINFQSSYLLILVCDLTH